MNLEELVAKFLDSRYFKHHPSVHSSCHVASVGEWWYIFGVIRSIIDGNLVVACSNPTPVAVSVGSDEQGSIFGHDALLLLDIDCQLAYV